MTAARRLRKLAKAVAGHRRKVVKQQMLPLRDDSLPRTPSVPYPPQMR